MTPEEAEKILTSFFEKLEKEVVSKYHYNLGRVQTITCKLQNRIVGSLGKKVCHIDYSALHDAFNEMKNDIFFLIKRRGTLIHSLKPSFGKISGIIAYRLAKNHIVHLYEGCAFCNEACAAKN